MKIFLSILIAFLSFATIYIACISGRKWYQITISAMLSVLITALTWL